VEKNNALHPVDNRGEGDIVGELSILTGELQNAHAEAQTDMGVRVFDRSRFQDLSGNQPELLDFLTELVADRLDSRRPIADRRIGKYIATEPFPEPALGALMRQDLIEEVPDPAAKVTELDEALHRFILKALRRTRVYV
jgi:CRP-like cAMP-binding protein